MAGLPDAPNLEWLRKRAKERLEQLRVTSPDARLADAQLELAREHGFPSWRALKAHVESLTLEGRLFAAAREGDIGALTALLDAHPEGLEACTHPYEHTLLHAAAQHGQLAAVDLLLERGLDVNAREKGDNTYPMHWAAAQGHVDVVRRLADAGGDVVGRGDDHELEVIGWATCWDEHRAVADLLVERGARHHIFSAIALNLTGEVRRIVGADRSALAKPMSRHESYQLPLHFAVRKNRPELVELLLGLGADPLATDGEGLSASAYAAEPGVDRGVIETLVREGAVDLFGALALGDQARAGYLLAEDRGRIEREGALHLLAKRGDVEGVRWLLAHGAGPNARWSHWDAEVTPLHLAAAQGHIDVVRLLLAAGADPTIRDSKHDGDARGWAEHGRMPRAARWQEVAAILDEATVEG